MPAPVVVLHLEEEYLGGDAVGRETVEDAAHELPRDAAAVARHVRVRVQLPRVLQIQWSVTMLCYYFSIINQAIHNRIGLRLCPRKIDPMSGKILSIGEAMQVNGAWFEALHSY